MSEMMLSKIRVLKLKYETEGFIILGVFGSWARGEENPVSDLDLLYEITDVFEQSNTGWDIYSRIEEIKNEIEATIEVRVDLANIKTLDTIGRYFILPEVVYVA